MRENCNCPLFEPRPDLTYFSRINVEVPSSFVSAGAYRSLGVAEICQQRVPLEIKAPFLAFNFVVSEFVFHDSDR